jgi:hypothetical protein
MMKRVVKALDGVLQGRLKSVDEKINSVTDYIGQRQKDEVVSQVEQCRKKYRDFDQYGQEIYGLSQQNPGLSVEELYLVARTRKGGPALKDRRMESERPDSGPARTRTGQKTSMGSGLSGFRAALSSALDRKLESNKELEGLTGDI